MFDISHVAESIQLTFNGSKPTPNDEHNVSTYQPFCGFLATKTADLKLAPR